MHMCRKMYNTTPKNEETSLIRTLSVFPTRVHYREVQLYHKDVLPSNGTSGEETFESLGDSSRGDCCWLAVVIFNGLSFFLASLLKSVLLTVMDLGITEAVPPRDSLYQQDRETKRRGASITYMHQFA